jgi:hypothetical protein
LIARALRLSHKPDGSRPELRREGGDLACETAPVQLFSLKNKHPKTGEFQVSPLFYSNLKIKCLFKPVIRINEQTTSFPELCLKLITVYPRLESLKGKHL